MRVPCVRACFRAVLLEQSIKCSLELVGYGMAVGYVAAAAAGGGRVCADK